MPSQAQDPKLTKTILSLYYVGKLHNVPDKMVEMSDTDLGRLVDCVDGNKDGGLSLDEALKNGIFKGEFPLKLDGKTIYRLPERDMQQPRK